MTDEYDDIEEKMNAEKRKRAAAAYTEATVFDQESERHEAVDEAAPGAQNDESEEGVDVKSADEEKAEKKARAKGKDKEKKEVDQEIESLQHDLDQALLKSNEYFDGWQRERADFANYKKRIEREQSQWTQTISTGIIKKYLVIMDDMERALKAKPTDGEGATWAEGVELIYRKLQNVLEAEGIQRIDAESMEFNPTFHEAISHEDNADHESGEIIEVVQQGYTLGERVVRPALVRVAR